MEESQPNLQELRLRLRSLIKHAGLTHNDVINKLAAEGCNLSLDLLKKAMQGKRRLRRDSLIILVRKVLQVESSVEVNSLLELANYATLSLEERERYRFSAPVQQESVSDSTASPILGAPWSDQIVERTYFPYRDKSVPALSSSDAIMWLAERYHCKPFVIGKSLVPATVVWANPSDLIGPDEVLGKLSKGSVVQQSTTPLLDESEYETARGFIKWEYEKGRIKYEGYNYCFSRIDLSGHWPKIDGYFGRYYDNILTQYAMEWELKKALLTASRLPVDTDMPLRVAVERQATNPLVDGAGRCAAITISMLVVFNRPDKAGYYFLICRRSPEVGISAGMLHIVPAGMFETFNRGEDWSVDWNLWRELLEEVYNVPEAHEISAPMLSDHLLTEPPIPYLKTLLEAQRAELSVTGVCCDLLNLRIEICSVLFIREVAFSEQREMKVNWEWDPLATRGSFARPWREIDDVINEELVDEPIVASGAVCLGLGREWIRNRHKF